MTRAGGKRQPAFRVRLGRERPKRQRDWTRRDLRNGLLFLSPWLFGLVVLQAYPLVMTMLYSFTNYDGLNFPPDWVGLENFRTLLTLDPQFWNAVWNTLWWVGLSVPLSMALGLLLALLLNQNLRGQGLFRACFYLPAMVPYVGGSILFLYLFNPSGGPLNSILEAAGLGEPGWFTDPGWAKPSLLLLSLWQIGPTMIIFLAGLQDIPDELYEASAIDGAGALRKFRMVTLPLLTPAIFFNLVLGTIYAFSFFTQALVVSASPAGVGGGAPPSSYGATAAPGGPLDATLFYSIYLYTQIFRNFQLGYGAAMSLMLTVVVVIVAATIFKSSKRWVFYYAP